MTNEDIDKMDHETLDHNAHNRNACVDSAMPLLKGLDEKGWIYRVSNGLSHGKDEGTKYRVYVHHPDGTDFSSVGATLEMATGRTWLKAVLYEDSKKPVKKKRKVGLL